MGERGGEDFLDYSYYNCELDLKNKVDNLAAEPIMAKKYNRVTFVLNSYIAKHYALMLTVQFIASQARSISEK